MDGKINIVQRGGGFSIEFSLAITEMSRCPIINDEDCSLV